MKITTWLVLLLLTSVQLSAQDHPNPYTAVENFFEAFHSCDSLALQQAFSTKARLMQSNDENGKSSLRISAIDRFIKAICRRPETPIWEEILGNPVVQQHQHLATVWVTFQFYLDEQLSHCGINAFTLIWEDDRWKILSLIDTNENVCTDNSL